jgi:hypothetical protein
MVMMTVVYSPFSLAKIPTHIRFPFAHVLDLWRYDDLGEPFQALERLAIRRFRGFGFSRLSISCSFNIPSPFYFTSCILPLKIILLRSVPYIEFCIFCSK